MYKLPTHQGLPIWGDLEGYELPDFTQNFNRYSYCLNNPLMYTDPSGYKIKPWQGLLIALGIDALTGGAISSFALSTAINTAAFATTTAVAAYSTAVATAAAGSATLSAVDFTVSLGKNIFNDDHQSIENWFQLTWRQLSDPIVGMFSYDKNAGGMEWIGQVVNNLTGGEYLQDFIGKSFAHMQNIGGYVDAVGGYKGRTTIRLKEDYIGRKHFQGISFGHYVFGRNMALNFDDDEKYNRYLLAHEYGHTYQSRTSGWLYLFIYGIPSAAGSDWTEENADWRAYLNFGINPWNRLDIDNYGHRKVIGR